jgi:hypothetical protein
MTSLTPGQAKYIVDNSKRGDLRLDGLTTLSKEVASELSKHNGYLYLDGLTTISKEVASELSKHKGNF